jgi:hypothetical protein
MSTTHEERTGTPVPRPSAGSKPGETDLAPPISVQRLQECLASAKHWERVLPRYADRQQRKADWLAYATAGVAAITSLAIFPTADGGGTAAKVVVSLFAFVAAVLALIPRVENFGEMAGKARSLHATFGHHIGQLEDALAELQAGGGSDAARRQVVNTFEEGIGQTSGLRFVKEDEKDPGTR